MEATDQIDRLIEGRSKGRAEANREAERVKAEDRRKREEMHQEHKVLWIEHFRRLTITHLELAKDYRRRAQALSDSQENGG